MPVNKNSTSSKVSEQVVREHLVPKAETITLLRYIARTYQPASKGIKGFIRPVIQ